MLSTVARSEVGFSVEFISANPEILWHIGAFCIISCIGQTFIFYAVTTLGSLICSLVTTTRKLFTVLLSVLFVGHNLTRTQAAGVAIVFSGLLWDSLSSKPKPQTKIDQNATPKEIKTKST
jgi:solute carrier family 35 (UDP-galactose transporter), member B1